MVVVVVPAAVVVVVALATTMVVVVVVAAAGVDLGPAPFSVRQRRVLCPRPWLPCLTCLHTQHPLRLPLRRPLSLEARWTLVPSSSTLKRNSGRPEAPVQGRAPAWVWE
jgi:hypothetical protein